MGDSRADRADTGERSGAADARRDRLAPVPPTDDDAGFRGAQVCSLVGITYRQLDYWARTGLLRPSIADAKGSGSQRRYAYRDVLELKVIKRLLDAGLKLQQARQAVECLRGDLGEELASAQLVLALLAGGQGVFNILPLSGVVSELEAAIVEIDAHAAGQSDHLAASAFLSTDEADGPDEAAQR